MRNEYNWLKTYTIAKWLFNKQIILSYNLNVKNVWNDLCQRAIKSFSFVNITIDKGSPCNQWAPCKKPTSNKTSIQPSVKTLQTWAKQHGSITV